MPINNALTPEGLNALGAAFGFYPQLRRNRTVQDPRAALDMPMQFFRGRAAATAGMPSDILNMLRTPMPMEMYGNTDYGPQTQVPYGSQELLKTLPLAPQGPAQQAAANLGALVPMTPAEALQAARLARQAALAGIKYGKQGARVLGEELNATLLGERPNTLLGAITPKPLYAVEPNVNQLAQIAKPKAEVSPLGFYSAVEQQALNLPRKQGTGASFLNDLMKGQDVKKYEIEAMGLDQFLASKPNVTKQEVQDFIQSNRINLQERQLGAVVTEDPVGIANRKVVFDKYEPEIQALYMEMDNPRYRLVNRGMGAEEYNRGVVLQNRGFRGEPLTVQEQSELNGILQRLDGNTVKEFANAEEARKVYLSMDPEKKLMHSIRPVKSSTELQQEINKIQNIRDAEANAAYVVPEAAPTRYGKYQLPGGENYREILLKLPNTTSEAEKTYIKLGNLTRPMTETELSEYRNARDIFLKETTQDSRTYKSSHWTEDPNVLAHMRVNDRVDADGKKMLLIEEIQSDWHQAGREQGYQNPKLQAQAQEKIDALKKEHQRLGKVKESVSTTAEREEISRQRFVLMDKVHELSKVGTMGVPDAPFKDTWYQLALKRAIKEAVDKGYDRIGLTTGKRQIERFSDELRQNVDEINFNPIGTQNQIIVNAKKNGQNTFSGTVKDGKFIDGQAQGKTVEEVLGKTMAKQIAEKKDGVIKGNDLTIGGEGMKKYYDEVYPAFLEKQGKKYGAQMGETKLTGTGSKDELAQKVYGINETYKNLPSEQKRKIDQMFLEKGESIRYLDITPEMREAVKKGQPLASITNHLANAMA